MQNPESLSVNTLSVLVIGRHQGRREALMDALERTQATTPHTVTTCDGVDDAACITQAGCDAAIVDLDPDPERAIDLIEKICRNNGSATVMAYSRGADAELLMRCMRAGAREFLSGPVLQSAISEALMRASSRGAEIRRLGKSAGKMLVFTGAKGGAGVTTIASNLAIALAKESGTSVVLVDLNLALGDAALGLGISAQFTILDALRNVGRIDSDFIASLLAKHPSGLSVLSGPDNYNSTQFPPEGIEKILGILREDFAYVVVDAGAGVGQNYRMIFDLAETVYLVAQVSVPELRNAHRFIAEYFGSDSAKLDVVLNRFQPRALEIDESGITKALMRPAKWKVPNDYPAVRRAQNTATPLAMQDTAVSKAISEIARVACGKASSAEKKRRFALFG